MRAKPLLPALLVALVAFAGCVADETGTTTTGPTQPDAPVHEPVELVELVAMEPILLGKGFGEPSIVVAPDGTTYVVDPSLTVWRSHDGGLTYTEAGSAGLDGGGDSDLAVDADGRVHWLGLFGDSGPIPYQVSFDQADSFSEPEEISDGDGFDRQWIDARRDRPHVYTSWRDDDGLVFRASLDGGATWEEKQKIRADALGGPVTHDPSSDRIYVPFVAGGEVQVAVSADLGNTWQEHVAAPASTQMNLFSNPTAIFPVAAVDQAGTVYLVYSTDAGSLPAAPARNAARLGIFLVVSKDHGATWTEPMLLSDPGRAAIMPWVVAGVPGRIAVAWYENEHGMPNEHGADLWNVRLWVSVDADAAAPKSVTSLLNKEPVHVGSICTSGGGCLFTASDRSQLDFFEIAIRPDGQVLATWTASLPYSWPTEFFVPALRVEVYAGGTTQGPSLL